MKCIKCGTEVQGENVKFCPNCGGKIEPLRQDVKAGRSIAQIWPEWELENQLGKGSYGDVYQAVRRDNNVESYAAIKIISIPSDASEIDSLRSEGLDMDGTKTYFKGIVDDFVGEIQLMESLKGIQNIVSVEDYKVVEKSDAIGWDIYIRMELLTPFNNYICDKTLSEKDVIKIGTDICNALEICGQRNIIHRDIKPENIFINDFGYFKLGDFGIARKLENMTGGLSQKGTYNYMAPEVANSREYDSRVDTYSLGIVLYRLMNNNKLPFLDTDKQLLNPNERKVAVERRLRGEALPAPCNASPEMAQVILRACAPNPDARFGSAQEMKQALLSVAEGTYHIFDNRVESTVSVQQAQMNYDATTAVRRASTDEKHETQPKIDTFGDKPMKKMGTMKKIKIIGISTLVAVIALVIMFFSSAAYGVYSKFDDGKVEKALSEYHADVEGSFIQETILDVLLGERVNSVVKDFKNGKVKYEDAVSELVALKEMGFKGTQKKIAEITQINYAANAMEKADEYYENNDYENAIREYSKIPETDENYEKAQSRLDTLYVDYINSTVETAKKYNSAKNYKQAVQIINVAYDVLPDGVDAAELDNVKESSLASYKTEVATQVETFIAEERWTEAFSLVDEAISFDDNEYFQSLKTSTEDEYASFVSKNVESYLKNEDYGSATRVVESALSLLPANSKLIALKNKVVSATPMYLLDVCKPYQVGEYYYKEYVNGEKFTVGGVEMSNGFSLCANDGYAIFNVEGKYSSLSFSLGHVAGSDADYADAVAKIYFDGVLVKSYNVKSGDLAVREKLDVTGVKQIKIEMENGYNSVRYGFGNISVK